MPVQALARLEVPDLVRAKVVQSYAPKPMTWPRWMQTTSGGEGTYKIPGKHASVETQQIYSAFLCANTVCAGESAQEVLKMCTSETQELLDGAAGVTPVDHSLPPRTVSIALATRGKDSQSGRARSALDGLATLGKLTLRTPAGPKTMTTQVRMSVFAGPDAEGYIEHCSSGLVESSFANSDGTYIVVRWANEGKVRTECIELTSSFAARAPIMETIQQALLSLSTHYKIPLSHDTLTHVQPSEHDTWFRTVQHACDAFFNMFEGETVHTKQKDLMRTGIFVRFCSRTVEDGASDPSSFHGLLLAAPEHAGAVHVWAESIRGEMLNPNPEWNLHTLAMQARWMHLGNNVSLYVSKGICKQAIREPATRCWNLHVSLVPFEATLEHFALLPCAKENIYPGNRAFEATFNDLFHRVIRLFGRVVQHEEETPEDLPMKLPTQTKDPVEDAHNTFALAAFGLNCSSKRITVGEAFAEMVQKKAPASVTNYLCHAALVFGVGTSLLDCLGRSADFLKVDRKHELEDDLGRLTRICDAALELHTGQKRGREAPEFATQQLQLVLKAANLCEGNTCALPEANGVRSEFETVVHTLARALIQGCYLTREELKHATDAAMRLRSKGMLPSVASALVALRGCARCITTTILIVTETVGWEGFRVNRLLPNGQLQGTTLGTILDLPKATVLLVQLGDVKGQLTTTACA